MLKAIKVKIYPNKQQIEYIVNLLGSSRFVYNKCLEYKINAYNQDKTIIGFKELGKHLTDLKATEEFKWLKDVHSKVLQQSLINLNEAYKRFFINNTGFPKFKSKKDNKSSCRFPVDAIIGVKDNKLSLVKQLKNMTFKCSARDVKKLNACEFKSVTLSKTRDGQYFCSILIDTEIEKLDNKKLNHIVGIDIGIKTFIVDSKGNEYVNLKLTRNNQKKIATLHKRLSKKQKGSNNREKARIKLAKFHTKLNDKKEHYLHAIVNKLLSENQAIAIENLNVKGMMKNHNLVKSIQELSISRFVSILEYKSKWHNRTVVEIDRFYPSSKLCSCCGHKNDNLTLADRTWICVNCQTTHDRDKNAATNIENEGSRILKVGTNMPNLRQ